MTYLQSHSLCLVGATSFLSLCLPPPHLGTIFLWIFWPSFNSAPTTLGDGQHRTVLNTYYSLTASTLSTFALSALVGRDGRLDMVWEGGRGRRDWEEEERSETLQGPFSGGTGKGAGTWSSACPGGGGSGCETMVQQQESQRLGGGGTSRSSGRPSGGWAQVGGGCDSWGRASHALLSPLLP